MTTAASLPLNLHEYQEAARAALPPMFYDYVAGGAGDEITLRENRAAFTRWRLLPRVLRGIEECNLATTVLGREIPLPVLIGPTGFHRLMHPGGEQATARAARRAGTVFTLSTASSCPLEEVAPEAGTWWFQLYLFRDRAITRDLVQRAEAAGASALVVTVDVPVLGRREADERNRFAFPDGITWANLRRMLSPQAPAGVSSSALATDVTTLFEPALRWEDLDWLASITSLPVVPKGILAPDDARLALEHGARALVVSNHGGRQLDGAIASLDTLPAVAEAVSGRAELLIDGGIRRGTDVLKALALGARAILLGRPILWGLAVGGEEGIVRVLGLLRAEIARDLTLCGCAGVSGVDRSLVVPAGPLSGPAR